MKINHEELIAYYKAVRHSEPGDGEYKDAIEAILNVVPELIIEHRTLQEKVQKLAQQRNWLINELCVDIRCDFPSQVECKHRTERGYYCSEQKEKFKCWIAHAEKATKE